MHFLISFPTCLLACRLTRVVEDALSALIDTSPSTQQPPYWRFGAVKGALCRLEWMGAPSVLRPIAHVRAELHSLVEGFDWETLESTLVQFFFFLVGVVTRSSARA